MYFKIRSCKNFFLHLFLSFENSAIFENNIFHVPLLSFIYLFFSDEKSTYNENNMPVADTSLYSSNSSFSTTNTDSKRDTDQPATPMSLHLPNSVHQNLISVSSSSGISTEASPRKKPRKQNVYVNFYFFYFVS